MVRWIKERFGIIKSSTHHPTLLFVWGLLNVADFVLGRFFPQDIDSEIPRISTLMPWYFWIIGWLVLLLSAVIEYALKISEETSANKTKTKLMFAEDFLETKCKELEDKANAKSLTQKSINDWRTQLLLGFQTAFGDSGYSRLDSMYRFVVMNNEKAGLEHVVKALIKMVRNLKKSLTSSELIQSFEPDDLKKFEEE
jgi:hypothetical protein